MRFFATLTLTALAELAISPATAYKLHRRQVPCTDIGLYFKEVNTALFAIDYMSQGYHTCDTTLIPYFNNQGLVGTYAMTLICLLNAEREQDTSPDKRIFYESLSVVRYNLVVTQIGLFNAAAGINDPGRNLSCSRLDTNILDEAQLPGTLIKSIICDYTTCTPPMASSSSVSSTSQPSSSVIVCSTSSSSGIRSSTSSSSGIRSSTASSSGISSSTASSSVVSSSIASSSNTPSSSSSSIASSSNILSSSTASSSIASSSNILSSSTASSSSFISSSTVSSSVGGSSIISTLPPAYTYYE